MLLENEFEQFYAQSFGDVELFAPLFYNFPIAIRFEIGMNLTDDKSLYVCNAVNRAYCIFNELFTKGDNIYVVVNSYDKYKDINIIRSLVRNIFDEYKYPFHSKDGKWACERYIIKSSVENVDIKRLLEEIVRSEMGGNSRLTSGVYLLNPRNQIIYYLYDDRGLDVVSTNKTTLKDIYDKFNDWILDYDRERIDKMFAACEE